MNDRDINRLTRAIMPIVAGAILGLLICFIIDVFSKYIL